MVLGGLYGDDIGEGQSFPSCLKKRLSRGTSPGQDVSIITIGVAAMKLLFLHVACPCGKVSSALEEINERSRNRPW